MQRTTSAFDGRHDGKPAHGDLELVARVKAGDEGALAAFVARLDCVPAILAVLDERLGAHLSRDELADLAQDTVVRIWSKLSTYAGHGRIETWAYGFCLLELMNRVRSRSRGTRLLGPRVELEDELLVAPLPALAFEAAEIERELGALAEPESAVIRLKHFDGLTFKEIGTALGIPENSAKTHYYRGLGRLRQKLRGHAQEDRV